MDKTAMTTPQGFGTEMQQDGSRELNTTSHDQLTVLAACFNRCITKVITPYGVKGYDKAFWFEHHSYPVAGMDDLSNLLSGIEPHPNLVIIRGEPFDDVDTTQAVLRRKDAWGGHRAYYRENPNGLHTMMADFDKLPTPPDLHPDDRIDYLVRKLPPQFQGVSFHFQWSSSSGLAKEDAPAWSTLSCHLWFYMEQARRDAEMMRWAETQEVDDAVMRTVQPNYTAQPIFVTVADPFAGGGRSGLVRKARDSVPEFCIPPEAVYVPPTRSGTVGAVLGQWSGDWRDVYRWKPTLLARLAAIDTRLHMPIQRAIACAVTLYGNGLDWPALKRSIIDRINRSPHGEKHIYTNDAYLDASHRGAVAKFGGSSLADRMVSEFTFRNNHTRRK